MVHLKISASPNLKERSAQHLQKMAASKQSGFDQRGLVLKRSAKSEAKSNFASEPKPLEAHIHNLSRSQVISCSQRHKTVGAPMGRAK